MLILATAGISIFLIGIPTVKLINSLIPKKHDPLADAQERLEIAKKEAEAARLNKEAEKLYSSMYEDALQDSEDSSEYQGKKKHE